jgi:hypothetical protein
MSRARILVVEDNPITRRMLRLALESEGYEVVEAGTGRHGTEIAAARLPDLLVQDFVLPDMDGFQMLDDVRALPGGATLPAVVVTGMAAQVAELRRHRDGPTAILSKPVEPSRLLEVVGSYLASSGGSVGAGRRILVVDDDELGLKLAALRLRAAGFEVVTATNGGDALRMAKHDPPDAMLSDVLMPGLDGFDLCKAIRQDPRLSQTPVVLLSSAFVEAPDRDLALRMGANVLLPRTSGLDDAIAALLDAMASGSPPAAAASSAEADLLHAQRLQRQLDKQLARNDALLRQGAIQAAALSVVRGLAQALSSPGDIPRLLGDVLVHCLDAAGLSTGLLYLRRTDGGLHLQAQAGLPSRTREAAARCFDHPELLEQALASTKPIAYVFDAQQPQAVREFGERLGRGSCLIVPFLIHGEQLGVLVIASDSQTLSEPAWLGFSSALATQFGQTIALGRFMARGAASEVRYRTLMQEANDTILLVDPATSQVIEANRQAEQLLGRSREDIVGSDYGSFVVVAERESTETARQRLLAERTVRLRRRHLSRPDGSTVTVDISLSLAEIGDESLALVILHDVTETERAEQAIRESEERFRSVVEASPNGIVVADAQGHIVLVNERVERLFGYARQELVGQPIELLVPEDLRGAHSAQRMAFAEEAVPHRMPEGRDLRGLRRDGSTLPIEVGLSPLQSARGQMFLATLVDVTERRALEAQLLQSQKVEAIGRLAGGVAHDFNNLLGVITGSGEMLRSALGPQHAAQRHVDAVLDAATRAANLTRQLLAFSRKGADDVMRVHELGGIIADLEPILRRLIGEDVDLRIDLDPDAGRIRADRAQIDQIVLNLAVNARDAMPGGGGLTIATSRRTILPGEALLASPGSYAVLVVSDTGHGMDAETQARVFEPFFTTKEEGKGTGLGLATVFAVVQHAGGHVHIDSAPGAGTTFTVHLPSVDEAVTPAAQPLVDVAPGGSEAILLVEDEAALRELIREVLTDAGYTVKEASAPDEALAAFGTARPDLVLADVLMPGMTGPALVEELRRHGAGLPALFISGNAGQDLEAPDGSDACAPLLLKPFTADDLLRRVREILDAPFPEATTEARREPTP